MIPNNIWMTSINKFLKSRIAYLTVIMFVNAVHQNFTKVVKVILPLAQQVQALRTVRRTIGYAKYAENIVSNF
jgi:hypothetical protein